ncbi:GGDEF domain-containing protein [Dissulfurirhabdus thermomarina]|uniref:GGDEF domain-containing protein n=1 Tax=Dissulfurirhabdus thermomarina TaxID=1765737 RepID=A0A6N9TTK0_DISTH|nr:GGDEF domain-containing protein [Dissulfurirhabdus thermomarina]NDY41826.1 GGDEF domain-containing protein [Dissulfurirhabdus thermomarina]NMX22469.1 GGDEF domain-containing protein [Dissulfurirhabdus thermomarina]
MAPEETTQAAAGEQLPQDKISEIARRALKGLVAKGKAPIPPVYEKAFYDEALKLGEEGLVAFLQAKLPPGQAAQAMAERLAGVMTNLGDTMKQYKERLDVHSEHIEGRKKSLEDALAPEVWAVLQQEVGALLSANALMREQVEASERRLEAHKQEVAELQRRVRFDALTGALNRGAFEEDIADEYARCRRYDRPFTLIIADIDCFKKVNDTYGHTIGDEVLKYFVRMISQEVREIDRVYRYGGEEFVVLLPETDFDGALVVAERLRSRVESRVLKCKGDEDISLKITASFGVTTGGPEDANPKAVLARADKALYKAKEEGRNRVVGLRPGGGAA